MNETGKRELRLEELKNIINRLALAESSFEYSKSRCRAIGLKDDFSFEELDAFEALTARFARISDMLTQKLLTIIFMLLKENPLTTIDKINLAEKFGIIKSAEDLLAIRELRNEISHEYKSEDIITMFREILKMSDILSEESARAKKYASDKFGVAMDIVE